EYPTTMVMRTLLIGASRTVPGDRGRGSARLSVQEVLEPPAQVGVGNQERVVADRGFGHMPPGSLDVPRRLRHQGRREQAVGVDGDDEGAGPDPGQRRGQAATV